MKKILTLALILLLVQTTFAAQKASSKKKPVAASTGKLGTSFKFDGSALRGRYQSSLGTAATVENDKFLEDLLGGRRQFADRIQQDSERN